MHVGLSTNQKTSHDYENSATVMSMLVKSIAFLLPGASMPLDAERQADRWLDLYTVHKFTHTVPMHAKTICLGHTHGDSCSVMGMLVKSIAFLLPGASMPLDAERQAGRQAGRQAH